MAKQTVNVGSVISDPSADLTRNAFIKVNDNFDELYNVITSNTDLNQEATHNRSSVLMSGDDLTYTLKNGLAIENGAIIKIIQNGENLTIDGSEVNLTTPQNVVSKDGYIYFLTKTGTTAGVDEYTLTQSGASSEVLTINLVSDLRNTEPFADKVDVLGLNSINDGAGGEFYWDENSTEAEVDGVIIQRTGVISGRWIRVYDDVIQASWFGVPTDGTNAATQMQKAIDFAINSRKVSTLKISSGEYTFSEPLILYRKNGPGDYGFFNLTIRGTQNVFSEQASTGGSTVFKFPNAVDFGIAIQGARAVQIERIAIQGYMPEPTKEQINYSDPDDIYTQSRYSPSAAIVIDPFGTSLPPDGGYPNFTSYYDNNRSSSDISIEECFIEQFPTGIVISPNGETLQADSINIDKTRIRRTIYAVATCQDQSRRITLTRCDFQRNKFVLAGDVFGEQKGIVPFVSSIKIADACGWIFRYSGINSEAKLIGVDAEALWGIGYCASNTRPLGIFMANIGISARTETENNDFYSPVLLRADNARLENVEIQVGGDVTNSQPLCFAVEKLELNNCYLDSRIINIGKSIGVARNVTKESFVTYRSAKDATVNWGTDDYTSQSLKTVTYNSGTEDYTFTTSDTYNVDDIVVARHTYLPYPWNNEELTTPIGIVTSVAGSNVTFKSWFLPETNFDVRILDKPTTVGVMWPERRIKHDSAWNMNSVDSQSIAHGLTATELKTVRFYCASIISNSGLPFSLMNSGKIEADASDIIVSRTIGGDFDNSGFNNANVTIEYGYVPDIS